VRRGVAGVLAALALCTECSSQPATVKFSGPVNRRGTVTVAVASNRKSLLQMDLFDYAFQPTVVKVKAGSDLTLQLRNVGSVPHTFTSTELHIDVVVPPGKALNQPLENFRAGSIHFSCRFHRARGMQGGFVVVR